ncbi:MAG: sugar ABC transporter ATP-binding protein [Lachnospiraceae bacterium]|nr:sugar ABC transporter ATP-binding protein [Lachnospiraceae bacterium]
MEPILCARNISKSFIGVRALNNIDITINAGEIHCLAGENGCGKSTLVKCISGVYTPDHGEVEISGEKYKNLTPIEAMNKGIQVIYQDLSLFQHMTVAENIAISKLKFEGNKTINWKKIKSIAKEQLNKIGVKMNLDETVGEISMANRQMVAICRALAQDAKILFMDEPTTALTKTEVDHLMKIMLELKKKGLAIVFISHKLDEVFTVADTITIFRNGDKIGDFNSKDLDEKSLSYHMTGREIEYPRYHRTCKDNSPILEIDHLTRKGQYEDISMTIRPGDIIGLTGLLGSGRTELAMSLFGLNPTQSGSIRINGKETSIASPMAAKKQGIALLPEDRFNQGLFIERKIKENISSALIDTICKKGLIRKAEEDTIAQKYVNELKVRTPSIETVVGTLSGGNQQKVVIGKWTATAPKVFIMDTPTVGIDIGSKSEIYEQIHKFADGGMAIIFISDEIQEIMANCNRVIVLANGKCIREFDENELGQDGADKIITDLIGSQSAEEVTP